MRVRREKEDRKEVKACETLHFVRCPLLSVSLTNDGKCKLVPHLRFPLKRSTSSQPVDVIPTPMQPGITLQRPVPSVLSPLGCLQPSPFSFEMHGFKIYMHRLWRDI